MRVYLIGVPIHVSISVDAWILCTLLWVQFIWCRYLADCFLEHSLLFLH